MFTIYTNEELKELVVAASKPKAPIKIEQVVQEKRTDIAKLDIKSLARIGSILKFNTGTVLFKQGDDGSDMFLILSGNVDVLDEKGVVASLGAGDMFGEMSLVDSMPRSATVIATSSIDVLRLTRDNFNDIVAKEPEIAFRVMQTLSKRVRLMNQAVFMLKNKGLEESV